MMRFSRTTHDDRTVLKIEGTLDIVTAQELRPVIDLLVSDGTRKVVVDMSALELIDSSGVGIIVSLYKRLKQAGGEMTVEGIRNQPLAIFKLLRMDRVFVR